MRQELSRARIALAARFLLFLFFLAACRDAPTAAPPPAPPPIDLARPWRPALPENQGIDGAALAAALEQARGVAGLRSLLVVRNAYLARSISGGR